MGNENEDDWVSMNNHGRIRLHDRRIGGGLVWNLQERGEVDGDLDNIKMQIPTFQGWNDPKAYLEWEKYIKLIYDCHGYYMKKKVKLVVIELTDYAIIWWDQCVTSRRRNWEGLSRLEKNWRLWCKGDLFQATIIVTSTKNYKILHKA